MPKDEIKITDLLEAFKDLKTQYFLLENHMTNTKIVYEGLMGLVHHKNLTKLHGPDSCKITRLNPDIGKLLYEQQKGRTSSR